MTDLAADAPEALSTPRRVRFGPRTALAAGSAVATLAAVIGLVIALAPPAAGQAADGCIPSADVGCLAGTIRTAAGDPAPDVTLQVDGPGGSVTAQTGADGRWAVALTEPGEHQVTIDTSTLPPGESLRDPAADSRLVTVTLGAETGALFPLGGAGVSGPPAPPAPDPAPGDTDGETPGDTEPSGPAESSDGSGITTSRVAQQAANGLVFGLLLALAAVGLSLVYGTTGLSSFSHGEQVTLGAIAAYVAARLLDLPLVVAAVLAVVVGGVAGWLQDAGIWRPLRRRRVGLTQQMIVTIGLSMALQYTFQLFLGGGRLRIETASSPPVRMGPVVLSAQTLVSAGIALAVLGGVACFLLFTRTGRATRAVSDNPALAAASGIGVDRVIRIVWTGSAALAALGGVLTGLYFQATTWNMGGTILLLMFAAVTLGGLGTAFGALAGSMVIGLVSEMASLVIPSDMRFAGALLILILVLLVRPQGILGRRERVG